MKRKCLANEACPLMRGYNAIGDWWSLLIVTQIMLTGARRFSDLQSGLGMAKNMLTDRLKKLADEEIVEKVPASDGSAYHEYALTKKGEDLYKVVVALRQWGETYYPNKSGNCGELVDRHDKKAIPPLQVRSSKGRVLAARDLEVADV